MNEANSAAMETSAGQRVGAHRDGPLLVVGAPGTGKTELLARRLANLAAIEGPERVLMIGSTRATARRLRERSEALLHGPFEELWIGSWDSIGERLLREHSEAAGLDPFFDVLGRAERLAVLLDQLDQLPLRRHEIRGNPAGLLARLLARIDALKAEAVGPTKLEERARQLEREAGDEAEREAAQRELEFAQLFSTHDRI
ncbi:MAG TPA: UvrD-helicase domain-containing protein, partial [Solirubrobacterales bacterium]|nr:UvrD-helicase domain-containing protein [Solirubrobacterales bacterium]